MRKLYRRAAGSDAERVEFIEQPDALGYGDAIYRGREFTGSDAFLLMVSDHIYISRDAGRSCARQLVETATNARCPVSAVQSTHKAMLASFGAVGGTPHDGMRGLYEIERVLEKPTPTSAEQDHLVPGLRHEYYLSFFGMHLLTPPLMRVCSDCTGVWARHSRLR
jgi:UTP--glucose-1-phosphate uridylyltransferase